MPVTNAATHKVRTPHTSFKYPSFDCSTAQSQSGSHNRAVTQSLEVKYLDTGPGDALITTKLNTTESSQLWSCLFQLPKSAVMARFDDHNTLQGKGFEMVTILRDVYTPTGDNAVLPSFNSLFFLKQKDNKARTTYMSLIQIISAKLKGGDIDLPPHATEHGHSIGSQYDQ